MTASPGGPRGRGGRQVGPGTCPGPGGGIPGGGPGGGRYRRSVLEAAVLSSLAGSDTHGYDLVEQISSLASDLVCVDSGTMYRMLRGMEHEGLVTSSWQTPEAGPSRRVYAITHEGISALEAMAESLSRRAAALQQLADTATQVATKFRRSAE